MQSTLDKVAAEKHQIDVGAFATLESAGAQAIYTRKLNDYVKGFASAQYRYGFQSRQHELLSQIGLRFSF